MNTLINYFQHQLQEEAETARKMLERVPADKLDWQPHPKSMSLVRLATHVAEIPNWIPLVTEKDELDFANNPYKVEEVGNTAELLSYFDRSLEDGRSHLVKTREEILDEPWTLRNGSDVYHVATKGEIIRLAYCQIVHHRAQLGVFLRLLDIPIPGSYGPSADE